MEKLFLILGGIVSLLIALLYVAIPLIGAEAYLACGGWWLLPLLEQESPLPAMLTWGIAEIFSYGPPTLFPAHSLFAGRLCFAPVWW